MSRTWHYLTCFAALATIAWGGALAPAQSQADHDRIANLIMQLGSPKFAERERASRELEAIGVPAWPQLRAALKSDNPESRRRAEVIVTRVEDKLAASALLAPKIVRLNLKDVAVADAVQQLCKLSGYSIIVQGDVAQLSECKITLDTGEVMFWQAFDRLCAAGRIAEFQAPEHPPFSYPSSSPMPMVKAGPVEASHAEATRTITVRCGTPESFPTWYQGSLRIRLVPSVRIGTTSAPPPVADQSLYGLELTPEPRMRACCVAASPTVTKALDDLGHTLTQSLEPFLLGDLPSVETALALVNRQFQAGKASLRLDKGDRKAASIKTLHGTIAVKALSSELEPLIIVDDLLGATQGPVLGTKGGLIEIVSIRRSADGSITTSIRFETPHGHYPAQGELSGSIRNVDQDYDTLIAKRRNELAMRLLDFQRLHGNAAGSLYTNDGLPVVLDSKGRLLTREWISESKYMLQGDRLIQLLTMTFRPPTGVGPPAQMVLFGHRLVNATVSFRFENVPMR